MSDERILDKIRKCLAMAQDSRGNAAECANAMRQAQALMAKHGLSELDLEAAAVTTLTIRSRVSVRNPAQWEVNMCYKICAMYGLHRPLFTSGGPEPTNKGWWHFIGSKAYIDVAEYTYSVLYRQILKARNDYVASLSPAYSRSEKSRLANDFCTGWVYQVGKQINAMHDPDGAMAKRIDAFMTKHKLNDIKTIEAHDYRMDVNQAAMRDGIASAKDVRLNHAATHTNSTLMIGE